MNNPHLLFCHPEAKVTVTPFVTVTFDAEPRVIPAQAGIHERICHPRESGERESIFLLRHPERAEGE